MGKDELGKQDFTAVHALHGAEKRLSAARKSELRRLLERQMSEGESKTKVEWRRDDDDGEWQQYDDTDEFVMVHTADEMLEMDFDEILDLGR